MVRRKLGDEGRGCDAASVGQIAGWCVHLEGLVGVWDWCGVRVTAVGWVNAGEEQDRVRMMEISAYMMHAPVEEEVAKFQQMYSQPRVQVRAKANAEGKVHVHAHEVVHVAASVNVRIVCVFGQLSNVEGQA